MPGRSTATLDVDPGRGPARTRRRCHRSHRRPAPRRGGAAHLSAGQWAPGDPDITIVMDAGHDVTRLAWVLRDLPVELVGRVRGDRVMRLPKPSPKEYALAYPQGAGRRSTGQSSASTNQRPGPRRRSTPTPPTTARPKPRRGTGSTRD
ncbi:transposase [Streptomyces sp. NPDC002159]